jgi:phage-related protein
MLIYNNLLLAPTIPYIDAKNVTNVTTIPNVILLINAIIINNTVQATAVSSLALLTQSSLIIDNVIHNTSLSIMPLIQDFPLVVNNLVTKNNLEIIRLIPYYALPIFWKIDKSSQKSKNIYNITTRFGDNYQQIAPDGLHSTKDNWVVNWSNLTLVEKNSFESLINERGSWTIYIWTPLYEVTSKKFRMVKDSYNYQAVNNNSFKVSMKILQIFDFV